MEEIQKVKTVLIASGSGTDAFAIMDAYSQGFLPDVSIEALISTKEGAGCLEKAEKFGIKTIVIDCKKVVSWIDFNKLLSMEINRLGCKLIFLVGCIVRIYPSDFYSMYNIHPADPVKFGGNGMYGLYVHEKVLEHAIDLIVRGKKQIDDIFYTYPTVHEVAKEYDSGDPLMSVAVQIPFEILYALVVYKNVSLKEAAKRLQEHVLLYEWTMLPTAVNLAALKILKG
jgi:phosphoribosylglycinamide formyltransferase-1